MNDSVATVIDAELGGAAIRDDRQGVALWHALTFIRRALARRSGATPRSADGAGRRAGRVHRRGRRALQGGGGSALADRVAPLGLGLVEGRIRGGEDEVVVEAVPAGRGAHAEARGQRRPVS